MQVIRVESPGRAVELNDEEATLFIEKMYKSTDPEYKPISIVVVPRGTTGDIEVFVKVNSMRYMS